MTVYMVVVKGCGENLAEMEEMVGA